MPSLRCLLLASSVLLGAHRASAEPSLGAHRDMRLSWVRTATAATCPDAGRVEADVERRLGWSPFVRGAGSAESIEAVVDRDSEVWRAAIQLRAADGSSLGSRNVESPASTCASLAAAAGLAIALMIEPLLPPEAQVAAPPASAPVAPTNTSNAGSAANTPRRKPGSSVNSPEASESDVESDAEPEPDQDEPDLPIRHRSPLVIADGSLLLGAIGVSGVFPRFALGVTLGGSLRVVERLYVEASGSLLPEQQLRQEGAQVGFGMTLGALGPCYRVPLAARFSVASCAALLLGSMQVFVDNPEPVAAGSHSWWGANAGLRLGWNPGRFEIALRGDVMGHFKRRSYQLTHAEELDSATIFIEPAAAVAGSLLFGVGF